jgi:hypothetical protein
LASVYQGIDTLRVKSYIIIAQARMMSRIQISAVWGAAIGALTFALGPIASLSSVPFIEVLMHLFVFLLMPGAVATALSESFILGAIVNFMVHFSLAWLILRILNWPRSTVS